jgi:membrane dipeptidase
MTEPTDLPSRAGELHGSTLVLDTHVDIPWPDPADPATATKRQVDFPKMRAGGMGAAIFIAYVPQGPRTQEAHHAAGERAEAMLRAIAATAEGDPGRGRFCRSAAELAAAHAAGSLAVMCAVENGYAMGHDLSNLAKWRRLGAVYVTLTHDGHNEISDSARPRADLGDPPAIHGGLSALGRAVVLEMNRVGLLIDVSHVAKPGMMQAAALSRAPIVATHACCRALCDHPRNLDDEQLDALRDGAGLVQITAVPAFLRAAKPGTRSRATIRDYVDHVDYAVARIGIEHVGLSSDFDGGGGLEDWDSAAATAGVTAELVRRGYSRSEIRLLWSGNFLRLLRAAESVARG